MAEQSASERTLVVDSNILAYYILGIEPFLEPVASVLVRPFLLAAPDSWRAEILSVIWQAVHLKGVPLTDGVELLEQAEALLDRVVPVESLWREALVSAAEHKRSTYDTLFVVLAEREECELVTYDQKLLTGFPDVARKPEQVLSQ